MALSLRASSSRIRHAYSSKSRILCRALSTSEPTLPSHADIVVVGGGIIGTSVAYHLAKLGKGQREVILLERDQLTSGTTWHAAGLMVTFGSLSETSTDIRKYTKELYSHILEEETGQSTGFKPCGFIELATTPDRLEEFRRVAAFNRHCGVDVHEIGPKEVQDMFPLCDVSDISAGFYVPTDGRVNPVDATMALAKGATLHGCRTFSNTAVARILTEPNGKVGGRRVVGVATQGGHHMRANVVINCAGMWARQLSEGVGVVCPNQAAEHYYLITEAMSEVDPEWPVIEDPSSYTYIRPEGGGLMVGLFEGEAAAWKAGGIPENFSFGEIEPDWERMGPYVEKAMARVPATMEVGVKKFFCGPESFTPDLAPIVGETPEVDNLFVAAGLNSIGILTGGGIGRLVARWVLDGLPDMDVTGMNVDRFQPHQNARAYREQRVVESLGLVYKCHYPNYNTKTCRGVKLSPLHSRLATRTPVFRDVSGWEGADVFLDPNGTGDPDYRPEDVPLTFGRPRWFDLWAQEHRACREGVVLMDMSFMSKFRVQGRDAGRYLDMLSTAKVDGEVGQIVYTQWLNRNGFVEADLTVQKLDEGSFLVVASDGAHRHVEAHMRRHIPAEAHAHVTDVTGGLAQINIQGPQSRALMEAVTGSPFDNDSVPFRAVRDVHIGYAPVTVARITYLGELGYEVYVPAEQALYVYDQLVAEGEASHGLRHAGLKALASLRMEKAYRDWGHDVDNTDQLLETGLGFTCDFNKPHGFIGQDAVLRQRAIATNGRHKGVLRLHKRLVQVKVEDPEPLMYHGEVLMRDGHPVGDIRAASYGHTLGGAVGLGHVSLDPGGDSYVTRKWIQGADWSVNIAGTNYPATVSLSPLYDPKNVRIKAE